MYPRNLYLAAVLTIALGVGCQHLTDPDVNLTDDIDTKSMFAGAAGDLSLGDPVYVDGPTWEGWTVRRPGQVWFDQALDAKWIAFTPDGNKAFSRAFSARTSEFQLEVEVYLPEDFAIDGANSTGPSSVVSLLSVDPDGPQQELTTRFALELNRDGRWQLRATTFKRDQGVILDTRDKFRMSFKPRIGWNKIVWRASIREGSSNDEMYFSFGEESKSWSGVDIMNTIDPFERVRFGNWRDTRGDRMFAVRGLSVVSLSGDNPPPPPPPDDDPPPPPDDPPPPPPDDPPPPSDDPPSEPPPPPPPGDIAQGGYVVPSGFWKDWRTRTHAQGANCEGSPCIRFYDRGSHGAFGAGSQAMRFIGNDTDGDGTVSYRMRFHSGQLGNAGGGKHLFNLTSLPLTFTPTDVGLDNWTRVDFNRPEPGRLRATVFNVVNGEPLNGGAWPSYWFDVPFAVNAWANVDIEWEQSNDRLTITVGNQSHTFDLLNGSPNVGNYIAFGNIYDFDGEIDVDDISWSQ